MSPISQGMPDTEPTYRVEEAGDSRIGWAAPFVVVAGGFGMALLVVRFPPFVAVAVMVAIILGLALVRNLQLGLMVLFWISALALGETPGVQSPNSTYSQGLMPSQLLLGFIAMLWLGRGAFTGRWEIRRSALNLPMIAFLGIALVSLLTNNVLVGTRELLFHQMLITQVAEVGLLAFSVCAFFLTAGLMNSRKWVDRVYLPVVVFGMAFAGRQITGFELPIPIMWGHFLLAGAIAFVYSRLLFSGLTRRQVIGLSLLLAFLMIGVLRDLGWVSGWIACLGVVFVVSWLRSKSLALGMVAVGLLLLFAFPGVYRSIHEESLFGGDFDRFTIWRDAAIMVLDVNPVLGVGPGNYHPYVYWHNTIWFEGATYTTAHSNYAQVFAELGVAGLAAFLWVIAAAIVTGVRALRDCSPDHKWLAVSATALVAAVAAASFFGDYLFPSRGNNGIVTFGTTVYTWLIMGAAVAASHLKEGAPEGTV